MASHPRSSWVPWTRRVLLGALAAVLVGAGLLPALHHHSAASEPECGACVLSHAPTVLPEAPPRLERPLARVASVAPPRPDAVGTHVCGSAAPRAPPAIS